MLRTAYHKYMESVQNIASAYWENIDFSYNNVESACRKLAAEYQLQLIVVLEAFEVACDAIEYKCDHCGTHVQNGEGCYIDNDDRVCTVCYNKHTLEVMTGSKI